MTGTERPRIVGFLCTWCAYRAADLVGTTRRAYPASFRPVRVICTGRVSPELILATLAAGADGVLVVGCHPGECHRTDGNLKALARVTLVRRLLAEVGIAPQRVELVWAAASEGQAFVAAVERMTEALARLGPVRPREKLLRFRPQPTAAGGSP